VAITPDGRRAYVAVDEGNADGSTLGGISVIDIATNTVTTTIMLGVVAGGPAGVAITPDGRLVYVPLFDRSVVSGVVRVIDTATNSVTTTVTLSGRGGGPSGVAITPDGRHAYVGTEQEVNQDQGIVSVIDVGSETVIARIPVNPFPSGIAITPNGRHAYVLDLDSAPAIIDTATHELAFPIDRLSSGRIAFAPDGLHAYVTHDALLIDVIDITTNTLVALIEVDGRATDVAITPDGRRAYVSQRSGRNVSVIDIATNKVTGPPIRWSGTANGIAITPDGLQAYVADRQSQAVVVIPVLSS